MRKYLEYFDGNFPSDIAEKTSIDNWPYVGYSDEGVVFTVIPTPVEGPANNEIWYTSSDGSIINPINPQYFGANIISNTYNDGKGIITFDGDVTEIPFQAFAESPLTSIRIPNSVMTIDQYVFIDTPIYSDASNWTNGLLYVDKYLVGGTRSMSEANILPDTRILANRTFSFFTSLRSVVIPDSVTVIGDEIFFQCTSLTSITYEGTQEQWNKIYKGSSWKSGVPATYVQCSDGQVAL
jgi:hypothetical protein